VGAKTRRKKQQYGRSSDEARSVLIDQVGKKFGVGLEQTEETSLITVTSAETVTLNYTECLCWSINYISLDQSLSCMLHPFFQSLL